MKINYKKLNPVIRLILIIITLTFGIIFFSVCKIYYSIINKLFGDKFE